MPRYLEFAMAGTTARARLLEAEAPETCRLIWAALPVTGPCGHVLLSGTSCAVNLDPRIVTPEENATAVIHTGDVMFMHYRARERHGFPEAESKIFWAYDRYCMPRTMGKMTPEYPTVFAAFHGDPAAFYQACRDTFYGGRKTVTIRGVEA